MARLWKYKRRMNPEIKMDIQPALEKLRIIARKTVMKDVHNSFLLMYSFFAKRREQIIGRTVVKKRERRRGSPSVDLILVTSSPLKTRALQSKMTR